MQGPHLYCPSGPYWVLLGLTGPYWSLLALLNFTRLYVALLGLTFEFVNGLTYWTLRYDLL